MWSDFAADDQPIVEELPQDPYKLSEEHQSGSWLSGDKKQRRQVHLGGHRRIH
jgi:hypothetical protein